MQTASNTVEAATNVGAAPGGTALKGTVGPGVKEAGGCNERVHLMEKHD